MSRRTVTGYTKLDQLVIGEEGNPLFALNGEVLMVPAGWQITSIAISQLQPEPIIVTVWLKTLPKRKSKKTAIVEKLVETSEKEMSTKRKLGEVDFKNDQFVVVVVNDDIPDDHCQIKVSIKIKKMG